MKKNLVCLLTALAALTVCLSSAMAQGAPQQPTADGGPFPWQTLAVMGVVVLGLAALMLIWTLFKRQRDASNITPPDASPSATTESPVALPPNNLALPAYLASLDRDMPETLAVHLFMPVLLELRELHLQGLVDAHLCPARIMLTGGGCVLTQQNLPVSDEFLAPEQQRGGHGGMAADIYSACAILSYMVTFHSRLHQEAPLTSGHGNEQTPAFPQSDPSAQKFRAILAKGMAQSPEERYPSIQALIYALAPFNRAPVAHAPNTPASTGAHANQSTSSKATQSTDPGGSAAQSTPPNSAAQTDPPNNAPKRRAPSVLLIPVAVCLVMAVLIGLSVVKHNAPMEAVQAPDLASTDAAQQIRDDQLLQAEALMAQGTDKAFQQAESLLKELAQSGDASTVEALSALHYRWGLALMAQGRDVDALAQLKLAGDYADGATLRKSLTAAIYDQGLAAYRQKQYASAAQAFQAVSGYLRADDYAVVANAHLLENRAGVYDALLSLVGFADVNDLLLSEQTIAVQFLQGVWEGDGQTFSMELPEAPAYTFPCPAVDGYYIVEGIFHSSSGDGRDDGVPLFSITVMHQNCIQVYLSGVSRSYVLYRQQSPA